MFATNTSSQENIGPNLSDVTETGRKVLKYALIGVVSYMVLNLVIKSFITYWKAANPPPPPAPTVGFGRLPAIAFPIQDAQEFPQELEVSITRDKLAVWQGIDRLKVFAMPTPALSLLADENARSIARNFSFEGEPEILGPNRYRWYKYQPLEYVLEIRLDNFNFSLQSDYQTRPELIGAARPPEKHEAISAVKSSLQRAGLLPADVATSAGEIRYLKSLAGQLVEAVSLSEATLIQVNLNRAPVDEIYQFYTPQQHRAIASAVLTNAIGGRSTIAQLDYSHHKVDYQSFETYPIKPVSVAIQELETGQAFVASQHRVNQTVVREVSLGYFDDYTQQAYLQPIWVFTGDNDFQAYVSAIHPNYVEAPAEEL